jgi:hypothetical protein
MRNETIKVRATFFCSLLTKNRRTAVATECTADIGSVDY